MNDSTIARAHARGWPHARYAPSLLFFFASTLVLVTRGERFVLPRIEDDAFYYLVIAKHIAAHGRSEFTPGVLTNGYQPLWMVALVGAGSLFGFGIKTLKALDISTSFAGFLLFAWLFPVRGLVGMTCYVALLWYALETMAINGMESSLIFPGFVLFVAAFLSTDPRIARQRPRVLFCAAATCIGARLDAAVFLLPILAVAPVTRRAKLAILSGLAGCALAYAAFNQLVFGAAFPVSGAVKSLGGLQLNRMYFEQLGRELDPAFLFRLRSAASPYLVGFTVFGLALLLRRRNPALLQLPVRMLGCALCGLALFGAKLAFCSSWGVWTWYRYPELLFLLVGIWIVAVAVPTTLLLRLAQAGIALCLVVTQAQSLLAELPQGFAGTSRRFIERESARLDGQIVAMGDRSGSFAFDYGPGVYQLEGLVNSAAYVEVLKRGGDLRSHLCAARVGIVVSYERSLGNYAQHRIEVLRPDLVAFRGPHLTLLRSEELTSFEDLALFREENSRIYAWKLQCPERAMADAR